jgi:phosphosulfolactate phosphohydrolase-like enzyme
MMMTPPIKRCSYLVLGGLVLLAAVIPAAADQVSREQDIVGLRLGQRVMVDDGSCPAGEIKEVLGAKMTATGIVATRKCIPRLGPKRK